MRIHSLRFLTTTPLSLGMSMFLVGSILSSVNPAFASKGMEADKSKESPALKDPKAPAKPADADRVKGELGAAGKAVTTANGSANQLMSDPINGIFRARYENALADLQAKRLMLRKEILDGNLTKKDLPLLMSLANSLDTNPGKSQDKKQNDPTPSASNSSSDSSQPDSNNSVQEISAPKLDLSSTTQGDNPVYLINEILHLSVTSGDLKSQEASQLPQALLSSLNSASSPAANAPVADAAGVTQVLSKAANNLDEMGNLLSDKKAPAGELKVAALPKEFRGIAVSKDLAADSSEKPAELSLAPDAETKQGQVEAQKQAVKPSRLSNLISALKSDPTAFNKLLNGVATSSADSQVGGQPDGNLKEESNRMPAGILKPGEDAPHTGFLKNGNYGEFNESLVKPFLEWFGLFAITGVAGFIVMASFSAPGKRSRKKQPSVKI